MGNVINVMEDCINIDGIDVFPNQFCAAYLQGKILQVGYFDDTDKHITATAECSKKSAKEIMDFVNSKMIDTEYDIKGEIIVPNIKK